MSNTPLPGLPPDPGHPVRLALDAGRWSDTLQLLQDMRADIPNAAEYAATTEFLKYVIQGIDAIEHGDPTTALSLFQTAAGLAPDFYRIHNLLGNALLELGDYAAAGSCYARATSLNPRYAAGFCNLGSVALAQGDPLSAVRHLDTALALQPDFAHALTVLLDALEMSGDIRGAITRLDRFMTENPPDAELLARRGDLLKHAGDLTGAIDAYTLAANISSMRNPAYLGILSSLCLEAGDSAAALAWSDQAIALFPQDPLSHFRKGNLLLASGRLTEAVSCFRDAVALAPGFAEAYSNLGGALFSAGQREESLTAYREAVRIAPQLPEAHAGMAMTLHALGRNDEALERVESGLALQPADDAMSANRGVILQSLGRYGEAERVFRDQLVNHPDDAVIHNNLAACLLKTGRFAEAKEHAATAVRLDGNAPDNWLNLGTAEDLRGNTLQAVACAREAARLAPDSATAWNNLGYYTHKLGWSQEAVSYLEKAVSLDPDSQISWSNLLFCMCFSESVPPEEYTARAREFGRALTRRLPAPPDRPHEGEKNPSPLKIGLVSGDFRNHPVSFFLESLVSHIDHRQFTLYAYNTHSTEDDQITQQLQTHIRHWKVVDDMPVERLARLIQNDGIHILIDLAGHTAYNRLDVFVHRPAPIQVSWLGYLASTGLTQMDYFLADPISAPAALQQHFTEKIWHLPVPINCFTPPAASTLLTVAPPPMLRKGHITFGSFQRISKISDKTLALWGRVLSAVPESRLRLPFRNQDDPEQLAALHQRFDKAGIDRRRVELQGSIPGREAYLATHREVDIILDTMHYQGITTTCEGIWMGVPTLTLVGNSVLSRQGASLLSAVGLSDWISGTEEEFIRKAVHFASQPAYLTDLRARLRGMASESSVMNAAVFTRHMEQAFKAMWHRYSLGRETS